MNHDKKYRPSEFEGKWQEKWESDKTYKTPLQGDKQYVLDMFPYPSGAGMHVGHVRIYTASDVMARYYRMKGKAVLHPPGFDAFGLPTENYAIKTGIKPQVATDQNIATFTKQMKLLGWSYDWDREVVTSDPNYYKWTQWLFQQIYKEGLVYRKAVPINWCPKCKTGCSDEEVLANGTHERCGTVVERREMKQWLMKITAYADRLLDDLEGLGWPTGIIEMQKNWIGRSVGNLVTFQVQNTNGEEVPVTVFTTRVDTLYGATALILAPEYKKMRELFGDKIPQEVSQYIKRSQTKSEMDRTQLTKEKTGVDTGLMAIHPLTGEKIPVWIADYVIGWYGEGALMSVPAHDERDFEFAKKYNLPIKTVIKPKGNAKDKDSLFTEYGELIDSAEFTGKTSEEAIKHITEYLKKHQKGEEKVNFKLRDWIFSRQRYWGEPFPFVYCPKCGDENGVVLVPEDQLPITLPDVEKYEPTETGESPLAKVTDWVHTTCPKCGGEAKRETDTMPNWAGSCWYFLRFAQDQASREKELGSMEETWKNVLQEETDAQMPVDWYLGGAEHAVLHLLYARFWQKVFFDRGLSKHKEPFQRLRSVGIVIAEDRKKMSKSFGNVINPDDIVSRFGADTLRTFEMFLGPWSQSLPWDSNGLAGVYRFLGRTYTFFNEQLNESSASESVSRPNSENDKNRTIVESKLQQTILKVSSDIEDLRFNTAVAALMELLNTFYQHKESVTKKGLETFLLLLSPFAPFLTEELYQQYFGKNTQDEHFLSIHLQAWPEADKSKIMQEEVAVAVQVLGKVRAIVTLSSEDAKNQEVVEKLAKQEGNVLKYLEGKDIKKTIFVPGKVVNFVI